MVRQGHPLKTTVLIAVVGTVLVGSLILVVGCSGARLEAPKEEQQRQAEVSKEQAHSPEATSEEVRCDRTRSFHRKDFLGSYVTNDVPGCPKGGTLIGTDKSDNLDGMEGDDAIRGLSGDDFISGGTGIDTVYGGPGDDIIHTGGDGEREEVFCGEGKDNFLADELDYISSSCEVNGIPSNQ